MLKQKWLEEWDVVLSGVMFAYKTSVYSTTGFTPYFFMFGVDAGITSEVLVCLPEKDRMPAASAFHWFQKYCVAYEDARESAYTAAQRATDYYDMAAIQKQFNVGDNLPIRMAELNPDATKIVWKYRASASSRASHQGRSRGARVTWSKIGHVMQKSLYFHGKKASYHGNRHRYHGKHGLNGNHGRTQDGGIHDGGPPMPRNLNFFLTFLLKRILKYWLRIWIQDRKLGSWPSKVWGVQDAPLRSYKAFKIQFS